MVLDFLHSREQQEVEDWFNFLIKFLILGLKTAPGSWKSWDFWEWRGRAWDRFDSHKWPQNSGFGGCFFWIYGICHWKTAGRGIYLDLFLGSVLENWEKRDLFEGSELENNGNGDLSGFICGIGIYLDFFMGSATGKQQEWEFIWIYLWDHHWKTMGMGIYLDLLMVSALENSRNKELFMGSVLENCRNGHLFGFIYGISCWKTTWKGIYLDSFMGSAAAKQQKWGFIWIYLWNKGLFEFIYGICAWKQWEWGFIYGISHWKTPGIGIYWWDQPLEKSGNRDLFGFISGISAGKQWK